MRPKKSEAHIVYENDFEEAQAIREKRIRWVANLLNSIVKDEGVEALKGNEWVNAIVYNAKKLGIDNASEELLMERFQSEGLIHMDKDIERLDKKARGNNGLINQVFSMTNDDINLAGELAGETA